MAITLTVSTEEAVALTAEESSTSFTLEAEASTYIDTSTIYTGSYEWTPSDSTQTIEIADQKALTNITINPIPSNYGLITWDGSTLTVS